MKEPAPVLVVQLFPQLLDELLELLDSLSPQDWERPTACAGWSVKDVALHLLGGDVGILSRNRDGHRFSAISTTEWRALVDQINQMNQDWVQAARRFSPRLLRELLEFTGLQVCDYFQSVDPFAMGGPVNWAGPDPAPNWLNLAREYTERWHHQQHIRDATKHPGLTDPQFLGPVLATFVHALPRTYSRVASASGTAIRLTVIGDAGGQWLLLREGGRWQLSGDVERTAAAAMTIDQEDAWRLFTRGITDIEVRPRVTFSGDEALGAKLLQTVAILA